MLFTLISSFIGCAPDVYCYPEGGSTEEATESSIPTPSQDLEDKEPSSEPSEEPEGEQTEEPTEPEGPVTKEY